MLTQGVEHRLVGDGIDLAVEVRGDRRQLDLVGMNRQGGAAPEDHDDPHHRGRPHDPQRLVARFVDALEIDPPEVDRDRDRDPRRDQVLVGSQQAVGPRWKKSTSQPTMYWPAETPLVGPVRM